MIRLDKKEIATSRTVTRNLQILKNPIDERHLINQPCQFMGGMEIGDICGKPTVPHYSYCAEHKEICYKIRPA